MPFFGVPIRNGLPIGLGSVAGFGVQQFDPSLLFEGGTVPGAWYDPSDLTTMFTTSAGTTPVAMPGQGSAVSVGLMLDKSQGLVGLGAQLVVNGDFSTGDLTNWQSSNGGSFALSSNRLQVTGAGANTTGAAYTLNTTVGAAYAVSFVVTLGTATVVDSQMSLSVAAGAGIGNSYQFIASNQTITYYFVATAATTYFQFLPRGTGLTAFIDDFSVKTLGPGNHAISFNNTTARPELRARVNLLTYSEEFNNGVWGKVYIGSATAPVVTPNAITAPDGTLTADLISISRTNTTDGSFLIQKSTSDGSLQKRSIYLKARTASDVGKILDTWTFDGAVSNRFAITLTADWTQYVLPAVSLSAGINNREFISFGFLNSGSLSPNTGTVEFYAWGADLRPANIGANVPAYQRIADANTYDTNGFPLYLRFDGIDDSMYTPANLNLSGTDKVAVFAGVRKLADTQGSITELSATAATNNGSFSLFASIAGAARWASALRGTALAYYEPQTYTAPITSVLSTSFDIAGASISNEIVPRVNGIVEQDNPFGANAGTGNFGTYPLYIGSRNNASDWLNGHLYSLAVVGSVVSAGNIAAMESWVAGRTGIQI